jgi:hypothetical protein
VIPALIRSMGESQGHFRVQAHAASALVNFCDYFSKALLAPYLDALMPQLGALLQTPYARCNAGRRRARVTRRAA